MRFPLLAQNYMTILLKQLEEQKTERGNHTRSKTLSIEGKHSNSCACYCFGRGFTEDVGENSAFQIDFFSNKVLKIYLF